MGELREVGVPEIVSRRIQQVGDHDHVELVGVYSDHLPYEPIQLSPDRIQMRQAGGEKFWVTIDGQQVEVTAGTCSVCGHEPYLRTAADAADEEKIQLLPDG